MKALKQVWVETLAPFSFDNGATWRWVAWRHNEGNSHAAIIEKARELGANAWAYDQGHHRVL